MTSHLDDGRLQELVDGEIPSDQLPPVLAHLAACESCRTRFETARDDAALVDAHLEALDEPGIPADAEERPTIATIPRPTARPRWRVPVAWAASLAVAAGAGYLARGEFTRVTGSPSQDVAGRPSATELRAPAPTGTAEPPPAAPSIAGVTGSRPLAAPPSAEGRTSRAESAGGTTASPVTADAAGFAAERDASPPAPATTAPRDQVVAKATLADSADTRRRTAEMAAARTDRLGASAVANGATPPLPAPRAQALVPDTLRASALQRTITPLTPRLGTPPDTGISLVGAIGLLGRRPAEIDGMVPVRIDTLDAEVRLVYRVSLGELLLAQRVRNGVLTWRLIPPAGYPAESTETMRKRVRS